MRYTHLTQEERYQISVDKSSGMSIKKIAEKLGRDKSTIYREIKRNAGLKGYRPKKAHEKATERLKTCHKYTKMTSKMIQQIEKRLRSYWSPEQISGYLKKRVSSISHETIYQYILKDKQSGGNLYSFLRCQKKRRRRYGFTRNDTRGQIKNRVSIDERPAIVEKKTRIGDWEGDLIIGKDHKGALVTLVDRYSKKTKICKVGTKTAKEVSRAIIKALKNEVVCTITVDNGKEFAHHEFITKWTGGQVYFAHAYCSQERGLNENTNGLIRQYFSKKADFRQITDKSVKRVERFLNNRPRKALGFLTPKEAYNQKLR